MIVQVLVIGKIQQHLPRQQMAVIPGQGIQEILIQPGQVNPLLQRLLIPLKCVPVLALPLNEDAAQCLQQAHIRIRLIKLHHQTFQQLSVMLDSQGQPGRLKRQPRTHHILLYAQIQDLYLKIAQTDQQVRMFLHKPAGRRV